MGARTSVAALIGSLALATLVGCDSWTASTHNVLPAGGGSSMTSSASILTLMHGATLRTPFQGKRRVEAYWTEGSAQQSLKYIESVTADGAGHFTIDPLELIEPQLPPAQASQFLVLQGLREALFFRYRDFEVRDLDLFSANYSATFTGEGDDVAGRAVERLTIQRREGADRRFTVDVDPENGLVLRASEHLLDGTLVSRLEFQEIDLDPNTSAISFHQSLTGEVSLPMGSANALRDELGFQPHEPRQLPAGYALVELAKLEDPQDHRTWVKRVYSDGVELLFFLEAEPPELPTHHVPPSGAQKPGTLRALSIGTWTVLQADLHGRDLIAMGKQGELALADAIRSAFP